MQTAMQEVKLGLIGAGWMARQHLEALKGVSGMQATAITSRTRAKAEALAAEFDIPLCADTVEELVRRGQPDALLVLVDVELMSPVTAQAIQYRLPLFVEKPAGMLPEDNKKLADLAIAQGVRTMVGFNRRYYSIFHKGIQLIKENGPLLGVMVEGHERMWRVREGGKFAKAELDNWIYANSVHTIDLLRFFGGEIKNFHAIVQSRFGEAHGDQFAAVMEFDSGAMGTYVSHWYSPGGWRVVLYGDGVSVEFKPLEKGVWYDKKLEAHEIVPDEVDVKYKPGLVRQLEAFGRLVREGKQEWPALDLEGAYKTMALAKQLTIAEAV